MVEVSVILEAKPTHVFRSESIVQRSNAFRSLVSLGAGAVLAVSFTACGAAGSGGGPSAAGPVEITFSSWINGSEQVVEQGVVKVVGSVV